MSISVNLNQITTTSSQANTPDFEALVSQGGGQTEPGGKEYKFEDPISQKPIKSTDADYLAYKKEYDVAKAKAAKTPYLPPKQLNDEYTTGLTPQKTIITPQSKGEEIGKDLSKTKGGQIVLLGEYHDQTAQDEAMVGIVKGLKDAGDKRQIIYLEEGAPQITPTSIKTWNATAPEKRVAGTLGEGMYYVKTSSQVEKSSSQADTERVMDAVKTHGTADWTEVPYYAELNELSRLAPDMLTFDIDVNHNDFNGQFIDRDTAMAMQIKKLREKYPDAIIIGCFGTDHVIETQPDNPKKKHNIGGFGENMNNPMAEQLADIYGHDVVHTYALIPAGREAGQRSNGTHYNENEGQYDKIITTLPRDPKGTWKKPESWGKS